MTLLQNLAATTNADLIGNDTNPALTIKTTVSGLGLSVIGASSATNSAVVQISNVANVAGATVAPLSIVASTASQAIISIQGVFISTASINLAANKTAFIIPVYHQTQAVFGYVAASIGPS